MEGEGESAETKEQTTPKSEPEIQTLPDDLIIEMILPRLPVKPVTQFKTVSKYWLSSISSNNFAKTHLKFQSSSSDTKTLIYKDKYDELLSLGMGYGRYLSLDENYNIKEFVGLEEKYLKNDTKHLLGRLITIVIGSSNGLLCMFNIYSWESIIWNPVTNQYHDAGKPELDQYASDGFVIGVGFGYMRSIDDYRIGLLVLSMTAVCYVNVYSLKTGEWEETARVDYRSSVNHRYHSVLVGEIIYWTPLNGSYVVGLNLVSGQFRTVPINDLLAVYTDFKVFEVKGCLALCCMKYNGTGRSGCVSDVFTLKMNGEENYTREKWFSVNVEGLTVVHIFETGICLVTRELDQLLLFDPSEANSRPSIEDYEVMVSWDREHARYLEHKHVVVDVWDYTECLISPSGLCARVVNEAEGEGEGDGDGDSDGDGEGKSDGDGEGDGEGEGDETGEVVEESG